MAIPKRIVQTFRTRQLPWITRWHVGKLRKQNPAYDYEFYDDERILAFWESEYPGEFLKAYRRLAIGASKADFFRYAVLYRAGGVYLDIDGYARKPLDDFIRADDVAVISREPHATRCFAQWALIYDKGHPFLRKTLEFVLENIQHNRHLYDVHALTGPTVYTRAVEACLKANPEIPHRVLPTDYDHFLMPKYRLNKSFLYRDKGEHWKKAQQKFPALLPEGDMGSEEDMGSKHSGSLKGG